MTLTNKDDAIKIKKLLGLNGDESQKFGYYNATDALNALMHFCDYAEELGDEDVHNLDFESSLFSAREGYEQNKKDEEVA